LYALQFQPSAMVRYFWWCVVEHLLTAVIVNQTSRKMTKIPEAIK